MADTWNTAALIAQLIPEEAVRLYAYDDATGEPIRAGTLVKGNPTIGIGRNLASTGITAAEATMLATADINRVAGDLDKALPWWRGLSAGRQRQMMDLAFNMGPGRLMEFTHFLAAMQAGQWQDAVNELEQSEWWHQVGQRGPMIALRILAG